MDKFKKYLLKVFHAIKSRIWTKNANAKTPIELIEDLSRQIGDTKEFEILRNFSRFIDKTIAGIVIPWSDISVVNITTTFEELSSLINRTNHTRTLVYEGEHDNIVGFIHIKDLYRFVTNHEQEFIIKNLLRQPLSLPTSMKLIDALAAMQKARIHIALVIDEYGSVDGMITIEDILESLFGPIDDEHDEALIRYEKINEHTVLTHARAKIVDIEQVIGMPLKSPEEECETVGGLVLVRSGRMVKAGTKIRINDLVEAEVIDASPRSLKQIKLIVV